MKFTLEIELGNESMQTGGDVLSAVKKSFFRVGMNDTFGYEDSTHVIKDDNGNSVGEWSIVE